MQDPDDATAFGFTATTVKVQSGSSTWTPEGGSVVTETRKHLFTEDWSHLGGKEVISGETVQWNADWARGASKITIDTGEGGTPQVNADDNPGTFHVSAAALFGDTADNPVYYSEDTWTGWNGQPETERKFFDGDGNELGSSYTNTDTWDNGGTNVTNTHTGYNDPSGNWLGYEWSNNLGEKGSNFESTVTSDDTATWNALIADLTWLQDADDETVFNFDNTSLIVQTGSNTFMMGEGDDATAVTESFTHIFSVGSSGYAEDHLGGKEVRDGETIQWTANWERGAVKFGITTDGDNATPTVASDSKAHELFSVGDAAVYYREESWDSGYGTETETTYYNAAGEMLGSSFTTVMQLPDGGTETNINYNDSNFNWLGDQRSDTNGNSSSNFETTVTSDDADAWAALIAEFTWLQDPDDATAFGFTATTVKVQSGSSTYVVEGGDDITDVRKHLFTEDWSHLGGKEVMNGETTQFNANFERGAKKITIDTGEGGTPTVEAGSTEHELFSVGDAAVYYSDTSWVSDDGAQESERKYFDGDGNELGSRFSRSDSFGSEKNYHDANGGFLGFERTDEFGSESRFESTVTSDDTDAWNALIAELTWLQNADDSSAFNFDNTSVLVETENRVWTNASGSEQSGGAKTLVCNRWLARSPRWF